ncbi:MULTISPECIES: hypothetical protein [Pirellulaceae]|nr:MULTISPECIES: hypothetical protein [Pirellulaceae]
MNLCYYAIVAASVLFTAFYIGSVITFPVYMLLLVSVYLVSFLIGRQFERKNPARFSTDGEVQLAFNVTGGALLVTGDFNFSEYQSVAIGNGEVQVSVVESLKTDRILRVVIAHSQPNGIQYHDSFVVAVDYGLLYIVDVAAIKNPQLISIVQGKASGILDVPIAELLEGSDGGFGVLLQPSYGDGEYTFMFNDGKIESIFEGSGEIGS